MRRRTRRGGAWWTLAAVTMIVLGAAAPPASGETLEGYSVVIAKDLRAKTVTLEPGVFQVTDRTRIHDRRGRTLTLRDVPVAKRVGPLLEVTPEAGVRYRAHMEGRRRVLDGLVVGVGDVR